MAEIVLSKREARKRLRKAHRKLMKAVAYKENYVYAGTNEWRKYDNSARQLINEARVGYLER